MHKHVITEIVDNELCIGCGICIGTCPSNLLFPSIRKNGDLAPEIQSESCPPRCKVCLDTCPFDIHSKNEDEIGDSLFSSIENISHDSVLGYYNKLYVGHSNISTHRSAGSSGGMALFLLEKLLLTNVVDAVICVGCGETKDRLFEFKIVDNVKSLRKMSGSRYYPVEIGTVLKTLISKKETRRFAITGLPCTIKGLRLAMDKYPKLADKIIVTVGLVCGHLPNKNFTEYLAAASGVDPKDIKSVDYRMKKGTTKASSFIFQAESEKLSGNKLPFENSIYKKVYCNLFFQFNACNFCDDIFADTADATVMDAWLPEYISDTSGTSFVISRSRLITKLLNEASTTSECSLIPTTPEKIIKSQDGVINHKRSMLKGRLLEATLRGKKIPAKRVKPSLFILLIGFYEITVSRIVQNTSKRIWNAWGYHHIKGVQIVIYIMYFLLIPSKLITLAIIAIKDPRRAFGKLKRILKQVGSRLKERRSNIN